LHIYIAAVKRVAHVEQIILSYGEKREGEREDKTNVITFVLKRMPC